MGMVAGSVAILVAVISPIAFTALWIGRKPLGRVVQARNEADHPAGGTAWLRGTPALCDIQRDRSGDRGAGPSQCGGTTVALATAVSSPR